jgi:hypothetical protein
MHDRTPQLNLERLPLAIAGPILRHTTPEIVTVWIALKSPANIDLRIYSTTDRGQTLDRIVAQGQRKTLAIGTSLHMVAVTATGTYQRGELYAYDLEFTTADRTYDLTAALTTADDPDANISYFPHHLPTFVLPPLDLTRVNIAHGSCRKPHGNGRDALAILDRLLAANANNPDLRPQQCFFTGDRIYGDDVAAPLLWVATDLGAQLLGWAEELPIGTWDRPEYITPDRLPSGKRAEIATKIGGFTAGLGRQRAKASSHLFSLGEYCAAYLLSLSPVVWPQPLPSAAQMDFHGEAGAIWDRKVDRMQHFVRSLRSVRRVLANVVNYTIFDDHDVSDDWNLNRAWCLRVLGKPLGRRAVSNALLAYSLFEAWGNTPGQFEPGMRGYRLFGVLKKLIPTRGRDETLEDEIARYVGLPPRQPKSNIPEFAIDGEDWVLARDRDALVWHYPIDCGAYVAIVCDTRTHRAYPHGSPMAPPRLLSQSAVRTQIVPHLRQDKEVLIVLSTNLFGLAAVDWFHSLQIRRGRIFAHDVGDAWNIRLDATAELLGTIAQQCDRATILTGDIHYAGAMEFSYQTRDKFTQIVQFTASACKNEEFKTRIIQSKLKSWLSPEYPRTCIGTFLPPKMVWRSLFFPKLRQEFLPTWRCGVHTSMVDFVSSLLAPQPPILGEQEYFLAPQNWGVGGQANRDRNRVSDLCVHGRTWRGKLSLVKYRAIELDKHISQTDNRLVKIYRRLRQWFYNGGEVIGFNNIAIVRWECREQQMFATQDVYWIDRTPSADFPLSIARYSIPIASQGLGIRANLPSVKSCESIDLDR